MRARRDGMLKFALTLTLRQSDLRILAVRQFKE